MASARQESLLKASRKNVIGLILAATVLFVVGIVLEKGSEDNHHDESVAQAAETPAEQGAESPAHQAAESGGSAKLESPADQPKESAPASEGGETPAEHAAELGGASHNESDEKVLGINLESTPFVLLAVIGSLLLVGMVWTGQAPWIFLVVSAAMIAFAVFDIAEVFHQVDRDEGGIAALAGLVAVLHLAAALGSAQLRREPAAS